MHSDGTDITKRPLLASLLAGVSAAAVGWALASSFALAQAGGAPEAPEPMAVPMDGDSQIEQAERALETGRAQVKRVQGLLDEARRERDLIRMTCLNDKIAQFSAGIENLEGRIDGLRDAVESGDVGRANHEYTVTTVIAQKQDTLAREVNQCVGQDLYETGETTVELSIVGDVPGDDPTEIRRAEPYEVPLVPPPASPLF